MTHGEYKRRFSQHWGTTIRGFFTDEPGFYQNYLEQARNLNTIAWTPAFPLVFREKKGYDLIPYLCTLWQDMGDVSRRVRHDYYDVLTMLYRDSYFKVIRDFLEPDGLCSMGHLHHEETLGDTVQMEGHFFEAMRYLSVPGIDRIDRDKVRVTEKLGSSAAHLYGRERCFSESYGCYGWALTPEEMKAEADWQFVQGINLLVPHAFFSSIEGVRSAESPPSEFYQNPYWQYYRIFAEYIARLGYLLTRGKPVCTALVYYPITSCWERYTPLRHADVEKVDNSFRRLSQYLLERQLDFDYADDAALTERAEITAEGLCIQGAMYATVVIPPLWNIPLHTLEQLTIFAEKGGFVVSVGELPARGIEAAEDTAVASLLKRLHDCQTYQPISDWGNGETEALGSFFVKNEKQDVWLEEPDAGIKYLHRHAEGQDVYFLVNENACPAEHRVHFRCTGIAEEWNAETGEIQPVVGTVYRGITTLSVSLTGFGSRLVVFHTGRRELTGNWQLDIENQHFETVLTDWVQLGMAQYSGSAQYSKNFWWKSEQGRRLWIDLGDVRDCAEIRLNGHLVATRLWRPYKADITGYVQQGENQLELVISNTLANALVNAQIPAGLLGPVTLYESPL